METIHKDYINADYFSNKTPFKKILQKYCDFKIDFHRSGSYNNDNICYHYNFYYNVEKFIKNLPEIKKAMLRTNFCKYIDEINELVEDIPDDLDGFNNAYEINRAIYHLVTMGCIKEVEYPQVFRWYGNNSYEDNIEYNKLCASKMKQPMIRLYEVNGWEKENWFFYFKYPNNKELKLLELLSERFKKMPKVKQGDGKSWFELKFVPIEYKDVLWESKTIGYMQRNNLIEGKLNTKKLKEILEMTDDEIFEFFYKGGIQNLFK